MHPTDDLLVRFGALRVGYRLGWVSVVVVVAALALDNRAHHRDALLACAVAVAMAHSVATLVPWREWLVGRRGQLLLDLWCAGLIGFVSLLVLEAGQNFALLLVLTAPFVAVVQTGRRRVVWLALAGASCATVSTLGASVEQTALRLAVVGAVTAVALVVARTLRTQQALAREADHRITNDLQAAADLLLLAGPEETALRIRAIAAVHRALAHGAGRVEAPELLEAIAATAPVPIEVDVEPATFDAATAQRIGAVANELLTNAYKHGVPPIAIRLNAGRLIVDDSGPGVDAENGVGLELVQRLVEDGLGGSFVLQRRPGGGTRAEVAWPH